jgi:hypothetical protein
MFNFVKPEVVRLDLGDGDWIAVKRELSVGEQKAMQTGGLLNIAGKPGVAEEDVKIGIDWRRYGVARISAYVVDWNAKDAQGKPVPFSVEAVEMLDEAGFERIENAISEHIKAERAKKTPPPAGEAKPEANS